MPKPLLRTSIHEYFRGWPACDECGDTVRIEDGTLSVDTQSANRIAIQVESWDRKNHGKVVNLGEAPLPTDEKWHWGHSWCVDKMGTYWIDAERFLDVSMALQWTIALADKPWFTATNWAFFIGRFYDIGLAAHGIVAVDSPYPYPIQPKIAETAVLKTKVTSLYSRLPIPSEVRWMVWERDNFTCQTCGGRADLTIDHIFPVSKGGTNEDTNLTTLCRRCNVRKGARW